MSGEVFQELYRHWKRVKNPAHKLRISRILFESKLRSAEIDLIRRDRQRMREEAKRRGDRNGMVVLGELHELEYDACRELCPELKIGNGSAKKRGWDWVKAQPWAAEFKAPKVDLRFF